MVTWLRHVPPYVQVRAGPTRPKSGPNPARWSPDRAPSTVDQSTLTGAHLSVSLFTALNHGLPRVSLQLNQPFFFFR
jgi:hypothetical protein